MNTQVAVRATLVAATAVVIMTAGSTRMAVVAQSDSLTVHDAWVREPAGDRNVTAAFAIVENGGAVQRAIVGATADGAEKAELHEMKMVESMMQMRPVQRIDVPAHGKVELKPGGLHVMLFGLQKTPRAGDTIRLTLKFDDGASVSTVAQVRKGDGMKDQESKGRDK